MSHFLKFTPTHQTICITKKLSCTFERCCISWSSLQFILYNFQSGWIWESEYPQNAPGIIWKAQERNHSEGGEKRGSSALRLTVVCVGPIESLVQSYLKWRKRHEKSLRAHTFWAIFSTSSAPSSVALARFSTLLAISDTIFAPCSTIAAAASTSAGGQGTTAMIVSARLLLCDHLSTMKAPRFIISYCDCYQYQFSSDRICCSTCRPTFYCLHERSAG